MAIITTLDEDAGVNASLKTNLMSFGSLDRIAFGCKPYHDTYKNVMNNKEFVVNLSSGDIIKKTMTTAVNFPYGVNELEEAELNQIPSKKVSPPRIEECAVHYECKLDGLWRDYKDKSYQAIFIGKIVAASADEELLEGGGKNNLSFWIGGPDKDNYGLVGKTKHFPITSFLKNYFKEDTES